MTHRAIEKKFGTFSGFARNTGEAENVLGFLTIGRPPTGAHRLSYRGKNVMRKLAFVFAVIGLAIASAKSYNLNLYSPATFGSTELKAGAYKVEVKDSKAYVTSGKVTAEANVKVESNGEKYNSTTVRFSEAGGKMAIQEIRLGGTNTKLVFNN
jgi:hypothetical protein